jgi:HSP20 family molecular chaperone IbpA
MSLLLFERDDPWGESLWPSAFHVPGSAFVDANRAMREMDRGMRHLERRFSGIQNQWDRHLPVGDVESMYRKHAVQPCIVEEGGQKLLQWSFDVSGYKPEDVSIKTRDNKLEVQAKHEDESDHHRHYREFSRIIALPEGTKLPSMKSSLSSKGLLTIQAPYEPPAIENKPEATSIPIQHE